ncbi:hypothetical protein [Pseudomonas protegens]|uniref:hypothetical protein n=1 Tax=Pseudomonas protegens TaxID=380021 RepID=UPI00383BCA17
MPTETQHLEQRVAALQSDLNTKDEQIDALTFSDKDRELSRRDWFEAAQAAEKRVEVLEAQLTYAVDALNGVVKASAMYERPFEIATLAIGELSASAEPINDLCAEGAHEFVPLRSDCVKCGALYSAEPSAPVERDERAKFEHVFVVQEGVFFSAERNEYRSMNGRPVERTDATDLNLRLQGWQARAALDSKATEGASHET